MKRCTSAGLQANLGQFSLGLSLLQHQIYSEEIKEGKKQKKSAWAKDIYDALLVKVQKIGVKNLLAEKWTRSTS